MADSMDDFLDRFSKEQKIKFETQSNPEPEVNSKESEINESVSFNVDDLLEPNKNQRSILDDINPKLTEEDYKHLGVNPVTPKVDESKFRAMIQEELVKFFQDKYVLTESQNVETIYLKVGNSLFKGQLILVE